jgi:Flp pilus assembly protein TadD
VRTRTAIAFGLIMSTCLAYAGVQHHQFLNFDDPSYVTGNPNVLGGLSWEGVTWAFTAAHSGNWHPLTWLSHMADVSLCGLAPGCHHLMNVALHVLSALLLFRFLDKSTGRVWPAAAVAALFALHPLHVESVAWIAERKDVLSTFWWMAALNIYAGGNDRPSPARLTALLASSALALLSKPMAVSLPFVLLLADLWPLRRWNLAAEAGERWAGLGRRLLVTWPVFLMATAVSVVTFVVQRQAGAVQSTEAFPWAMRLANVPVAYAMYLFKMIWPVKLAPLYPYPESIPVLASVGAFALLAATTVVVVRERVRRPHLLVGWLWFLGTLVPVVGFVQVGAQPYADRYTYVPLTGTFLMIVWTMADAAGRRSARIIAGTSAILAGTLLAVLTWHQVALWRDSVTLWTHTVAVTNANYRAYTNLGFALAEAQSSARAEVAYREALRLKPDYPNARNYLGALLVDLRRPAEAEVELRAALAVRPRFVEAHNHLGLALAAQGKMQPAIDSFTEAVRLAPAFGQARNNLGIALASAGRSAEALAAFEASVQYQPRSAEAHLNFAVALIDAGRPRDAVPHLESAIRYGTGPLKSEATRLLQQITGR